MTQPNARYRFLTGRIIYFLWPLVVTWLSVYLMSRYMQYYDIGINPGANDGFLFFIVAPVLLTLLYGVALLSIHQMDRLLKLQWQVLLMGGVLVLSAGISAFAIQVWLYRDYPSEKPKEITRFIQSVVQGNGVNR